MDRIEIPDPNKKPWRKYVRIERTQNLVDILKGGIPRITEIPEVSEIFFCYNIDDPDHELQRFIRRCVVSYIFGAEIAAITWNVFERISDSQNNVKMTFYSAIFDEEKNEFIIGKADKIWDYQGVFFNEQGNVMGVIIGIETERGLKTVLVRKPSVE